MHAKPDLRVVLKWMIGGWGSVIAAVIQTKFINRTNQMKTHRIFMACLSFSLLAGCGVGAEDASKPVGTTIQPPRTTSATDNEHATTEENYQLRDVAVNILWMQAMEHQKNEDHEKLVQTLQTLCEIQPEFRVFLEDQGINVPIEIEYDRDRDWVSEGLKSL